MRHPDIVEEKEKTVDYVHVTHPAVEIYRQQIQPWIQGLYPVLYSPLHYMVGNTSERLQGNNILHTVSAIGSDFCGEQPAFPEKGIQGNQFPAEFRLFENFPERTVIIRNL